jgi:hypothetical protein
MPNTCRFVQYIQIHTKQGPSTTTYISPMNVLGSNLYVIVLRIYWYVLACIVCIDLYDMCIGVYEVCHALIQCILEYIPIQDFEDNTNVIWINRRIKLNTHKCAWIQWNMYYFSIRAPIQTRYINTDDTNMHVLWCCCQSIQWTWTETYAHTPVSDESWFEKTQDKIGWKGLNT